MVAIERRNKRDAKGGLVLVVTATAQGNEGKELRDRRQDAPEELRRLKHEHCH